MTERKPPGVTWETWIDRQIREGMDRGDFDGLPGHGRPIADIDRTRDELWWVKGKLRREGVSYLPPTLELRKAVDEAKAAIAEAGTEAEVRGLVEEINAEIRRVNRTAAAGPPTTLSPFDVEEVVAGWHARRGTAPPASDPSASGPSA